MDAAEQARLARRLEAQAKLARRGIFVALDELPPLRRAVRDQTRARLRDPRPDRPITWATTRVGPPVEELTRLRISNCDATPPEWHADPEVYVE